MKVNNPSRLVPISAHIERWTCYGHLYANRAGVSLIAGGGGPIGANSILFSVGVITGLTGLLDAERASQISSGTNSGQHRAVDVL